MKGGFNTNVEHKGVIFHVQTQDKGIEFGYIETLIYTSGQVLASRRVPYTSILENVRNEEEIQKIMEAQHQSIIQEIKEGKFDHYLSFEEDMERTSKKKTEVLEKLEIKLLEFEYPVTSSPYFNIALQTVISESQSSIPYADIDVNLVTELGKKFHLFKGKTDDEGKISMRLFLPNFEEKKFAIIINASKEGFTKEELKKFFKKI
ncbi:hypothetical protein NLB96_01465 [Candidatus Aminicenantes bacterium AC-335-K20]|jgi:hypothetical protein|nr:hypothetical protein [SCandidatus Aminicenantes bacterium Aminicenantia_JdfR_composite]MCP2596707.1 hypothetical protein [Candidatus Aminicenantes bacterium AC-335-G13]MCP2619423.1 hypothetical protein [Candidatus Aminicenantes bacterium AC-335-K20]